MPEETTTSETDVETTDEVEGQETVQEEETDAVREEEEPEQKEPEVKKVKLKVNGAEKEYEESELLTLASKAAGADEKFREAADARNKLESILTALNKNPLEVLGKMGIDVDNLAEDYVYSKYKDKIAESEMTEEQKRLYDAQKKIEQLEKDKKGFEETQAQAKFQSEVKKWTETYDKQITDAMSKSVLPKSAPTIKRVTKYLMEGLEQGVDISAEDAVKLVEQDLAEETKILLNTADPEKLEKILGKEEMRKLQSLSVEGIKSPKNGNRVGQGTKQAPAQGKPKKRSWDEFVADLDQKFGSIQYGD